MDTNDLISELTNISESPLPEYGGFHPRVVATARAALEEIQNLQMEIMLRDADIEKLTIELRKIDEAIGYDDRWCGKTLSEAVSIILSSNI